jgi:ABC-type polysaccharide/polyol phosphate export permease
MSVFSGKPMEMSELLSVTVKALPYSFFVGSIRFATNSLVGNRNLVTKIYFPREVFPIAAVMANVFDFAIASTLFIFIFIITGFRIDIYALWIPWLTLMLILLATGFGMLLSCANLFYRDVKYIVEAILTFAIFFTPVFYEASLFGKWSTLLLLNPLGAILENINNVVVFRRPPDMVWLGYATICSIGGFMIGWRIFHKLEYAFAENI